MNVSGPWPIPKTFRSCNASSSKPGAGLSRTTTCTRLAEPSAASSLFNRSAAFTTLPARSGPDGSWRDQSSSFTVFCASARVAATIDAVEHRRLPSLCDAFHRAVVLSYCTAVERDYGGLRCNDPARTGRANGQNRAGRRRRPFRAHTTGTRSHMPFSLIAREAGRVQICGHRGYSLYYPENTLPAFRAAKSWGATMVEIDVVLTADGEPIILHDLTVDRTTDGHGFAADLSLERIRSLDAGSWFHQRFARTRIPTLVEALDWANGEEMRLLVEIKEAERADLAVDRVASLVAATDTVDRVVLISFDHVLLKRAVNRHPGITCPDPGRSQRP